MQIRPYFYGFKAFFGEFWMSFDGIGFFGADVQGTVCGESIIGDDGSGGVLNTIVTDRVFLMPVEMF